MAEEKKVAEQYIQCIYYVPGNTFSKQFNGVTAN